MYRERVLARLRSREARICIIGLGYVGLPLAIEAAKAGYQVLGIESNADRVAAVNRGDNYIADISDADLMAAVQSKHLEATSRFDQLPGVDVISICVPTPLNKNKNPDTQYIEQVVEQSLPYLQRGQLMVLESTTYPGTTEEIILPRLTARGFVVGEDFFLAYSPERIDPGNKDFQTSNTPKVVGGMTSACSDVAEVYYRSIISAPVYKVSSPRAAEMTKLLENIFRIVNVSLVNELAQLSERMDINIWEVIEAAKTKPFGYMPFYPGPGVGGHCIPIDPVYLSWKAKEFDFSTRFIDLAAEINDRMPEYITTQTMELLNSRGKPLRGARVLLLGVAYKRDVNDIRESPALKVLNLLRQQGASVQYHDPYVADLGFYGLEERSVPLTKEVLQGSDVVVITTDHTNVDYSMVLAHAPLIYDARNAMRQFDSPSIRQLGAPRRDIRDIKVG